MSIFFLVNFFFFNDFIQTIFSFYFNYFQFFYIFFIKNIKITLSYILTYNLSYIGAQKLFTQFLISLYILIILAISEHKSSLLSFNLAQIELYHCRYLSSQLYGSTKALYLVFNRKQIELYDCTYLSSQLYRSTTALCLVLTQQRQNYIIAHTYHLNYIGAQELFAYFLTEHRIISSHILIILTISEHKSSLLIF